MGDLPGQNKNWTADPSFALPLAMGTEGAPALPATTVMAVFAKTVAKYGDAAALRWKDAGAEGGWKEMTWKAYHADVLRAGKAFIKLGLKPFQSVSIIGFNSKEWMIADVGAIAAGGLAAGIYTTNGPDACKYIAEHSESAVAVCEDAGQVDKFLKIKGDLPVLQAIVQYKGKPTAEGVLSWEEFLDHGKDVSDADLQARIDAQKPEQCCTLIYTSGTTGNPKAVMISHDNATWTARVTCEEVFKMTAQDRMISYLPLSHIAAQMLDIHAPMCVGFPISFAQPDALKGSLGGTLKEVRPTVFLGVPRVWEKIAESLKKVGAQTTGMKKVVSTWAKEKGSAQFHADLEGGESPWFFGLAKHVLDAIHEALGLDQCRFAVTAAAPIAMETLEYFGSLYIPILELYGMSECTGPQTTNLPGYGNHKVGTCGRSVNGTVLEIANPDQDGNGEIIYSGRHIMMGYMKNAQATSEAIDERRFLHSGDVGKVDKDGFLKITGRIKELIITAGGENVPPVLIEDTIKAELPIIANIMVVGDKRKFLGAVVTLKTNPDAEGGPTRELAAAVREHCSDGVTTTGQARTDAKLRDHITQGIARANKKAVSRAQNVQKFVILEDDFTVEGGELTATLKLKRRIAEQKNIDLIEKELYGDDNE